MKLGLACLEDGLDNIGFRKIASYIKSIHADTRIAYVPTGNLRSLIKTIIGKGSGELSPHDIELVAQFLAGNDLIGLSSMTQYSSMVSEVIARIRILNPQAFIVWGGIHPIIHPEDAILHADAICTGEGEFSFQIFLDLFKNGKDFTATPGFWFRGNGKITRNTNLPLMKQEEMDELPPLLYQDGEFIFHQGRGFKPITYQDFIKYTGLSYNTVWSIGCPLLCTYCGNSKFIEYDKGYRRVRHSLPETIIAEIRHAKTKHPHISTIVFHDDSFMALPTKVIKEFSTLYKAEINLPFAVFGVIPNYVDEDKLAILLDAGLNRIRMGIQSGSENILEFYKRPTPINRIREATVILNKYKKFMIPPAFDIILDNPIETPADTRATLDLLHAMPRPFTLNVFALRVIPNTTIAKDLEARGFQVPSIDENYQIGYQPVLGNILVFIIVIMKIPNWLYLILRNKSLPFSEEQKQYPVALSIFRRAYLFKRAIEHLRFMDFSVIPGNIGYMLWRFGVIRFWQKYMVSRYKLSNNRKNPTHPSN